MIPDPHAHASADAATSADALSPDELKTICDHMADAAQRAARKLMTASGAAKDAWLKASARGLIAQTEVILAANARDLDHAQNAGLSRAAIDRLRLDSNRIAEIAHALEEIAALPDPLGETLASSIRPNGLEVRKVRVPLGVVFMIYESRPNVTADAAALCVKSGNAVILRGGSEAFHSNHALHRVLADALEPAGLPREAVQLVPVTDRAAVGHLLTRSDAIDLAIPRGGAGLIRRVVAEARMPVLKHYDGNCHVYIDQYADPDMAEAIILNAKVQRPGVCNAAETLLIHRAIAATMLPRIAERLLAHGVELRGDPEACALVPAMTPATPEDWDTEYLDLTLAVAVVDSLDAAIEHINRHGSKHTDAIVSRDLESVRRFAARVDTAAVMINASTRFNDGGQLGLGAEIGISTDKLHARGPCGLRELTTTKWIVTGSGHIRT
jgi:glutamate-5-semialdehyde dehydrogenase